MQILFHLMIPGDECVSSRFYLEGMLLCVLTHYAK